MALRPGRPARPSTISFRASMVNCRSFLVDGVQKLAPLVLGPQPVAGHGLELEERLGDPLRVAGEGVPLAQRPVVAHQHHPVGGAQVRPQEGADVAEEAVAGLTDAPSSWVSAVREYSAALQRFATCPYQFLLAAIHRLEPRREAAALVQLDPLTRGSMVHEIQAQTLRAVIPKLESPKFGFTITGNGRDSGSRRTRRLRRRTRRILPS